MKYKGKIEVECDSLTEMEAVLDIRTNLIKINKIINYLFVEEKQLKEDTKETVIQKIQEIVKPRFNY